MINSKLEIHWLPEYGSAIVTHRGDLQLPGTMTISIIGLDRNSFFLHHDGADGYSHEADALDYKILVAGTTEEKEVKAFWGRFQKLLSAAQQRDGHRRTAVGGRQGHQFTPTLVHALAAQAINCPCKKGAPCTCPNVVPRGGFADVGRHTGGEPRNTSFALVKSVLEWCLVQCGFDKLLFQKVMLCIHLRILEDRVLRAEDDSLGAEGKDAWKVRADLDVGFRILEVVSMEGEHLFESNVSITFVFDTAQDLRRRMDEVVEKLASSEAKRFILPDFDRILENPDSFRSPRIHIEMDEASTVTTVRDYEERIKKNIGPTELIENESQFDLAELLAWLKSSQFQGKRDSKTVFLRLRTVENVFWVRALHGFENGYLDTFDMERLLDVVNEYRRVFQNFETGLDRGGHLMTELRSRELLFVGVAYCLAFAAAKNAHNMVVASFGVSLRYNDMEHLVLADRRSWNVVLSVAAFLNRNHYSESSEIFSLRAPAATFQLAEAFARNDQTLWRIWEAERSDAESRVDKHWAEVVRKKAEAKRMRSDIADLRHQLLRAESDLRYETSMYRSRRLEDPDASRSKLNRCKNEVSTLKNKISVCERDLESVLMAPSPVCQPLPREESNALRWLFFLYKPLNFRVLSTLSFTGQQMLLPRPWEAECDGPDGTKSVDVFSSLRVTQGESLAVFYNRHQNYVFHSPQEKRCISWGRCSCFTRPVAELLPKKIGASSVDLMSSREDGIWYPDSISYGMEWTGGRLSLDCHDGHAFDPFRIPRKWVVSYFTEKLAPEGSPLQWAMRLGEKSESGERGNRSLACQ